MRTEGKALWTSSHLAALFIVGMALCVPAHAEPGAGGSSDHVDAIDEQLVRRSVISTVKVLNDGYVYPDVARKVGVEIIRRLDQGLYEHLFVSGVVVHLYGLGVLISSVLEIAGVSGARKASERVLLLPGFVVCIPVVLIALGAIGFDLWNASPNFVLANVAGSIGLGLLVVWKLAK